jgi:hypothetical protein
MTAVLADHSSTASSRVNYTLSESKTNSSVVLELWNELIILANGEKTQRLNGKVYLINQYIFS